MQSWLAVLVVLLVGLSASSAPATAVGGDHDANRSTPLPTGGDWQSVTNASEGDGPTLSDRGGGRYRIHVTNDDPRMIVDLDISLLQSPLDPGALTMSARGSIHDEPVVSVAMGVRFEGVEDPWTFLQNPFEHFEVVSRSALSLPFPTTVSAITDASGPPAVTPAVEQEQVNASAGGTRENRGERP